MAREGAQIRGGLSPLDPLSPLGAKPLKRHVQVRGSFKGTFEPLEGKGLIPFVLGPLGTVEPLEGRAPIETLPPCEDLGGISRPCRHAAINERGARGTDTRASMGTSSSGKPQCRIGGPGQRSGTPGPRGSSLDDTRTGKTGLFLPRFLHTT